MAGKPIDPLSPDESLFESGLLDSFTLTDLVTALETEFCGSHPRLRPQHHVKFDSIARIEKYLQSRT